MNCQILMKIDPNPSWPSLEKILHGLKTVLPNACLRRSFRLYQGSGGQVGRQADFVIEGYVDPSSLRYDATSPLEKPKRSEGSFGDHTGYYTLPEPYPVCHGTTIPHRQRSFAADL